jgi:hypothetical protein
MTVATSKHLVREGKIQGEHLDRLAVVYVRQSTIQQMERHQESTAIWSGGARPQLGVGTTTGAGD